MMNTWTLQITGFGKIREAAVQPAPLTLLIGDNNSGKSYIMTLLYGLLSVDFWEDKYVFLENSHAFRKCAKFSEDIIEQCKYHSAVEYTIHEDKLQLYQQLLNDLLVMNKGKFLKKLFNRELDIEELRIEFRKTASFRFYVSEDEDFYGKSFLNISTNKSGWGVFSSDISPDLRIVWLLARMLQGMLQADATRPVYFPTARTGFLLTYKDLTRNALKERFSLETTAKNLLTKPNTDFLMALSSINLSHHNEKNQKLAEFIENHIISGHIQASAYPILNIGYQPDGTKDQLPMYVSSAVVTETVPLLLFLKYGIVDTLLIEEPEISLHPGLQWEMARLLVRLMNAGMPVVVTTHSDIIIQHVNNMLKAGKLNHIKRFYQETGYEKEDLLLKEQVVVYQFEEGADGKTLLTKLPCGDDGFEAMTFYQILKKLNEQIDLIEDEREPYSVL